MALRAGYYGVKRFLRDNLESIVRTYDETIKSLFPRAEQAILGAKNFVPYPYTSSSGTINGITWTINDDGTVTARGIPTANSNFNIANYARGFKLPEGDWILSDGGVGFDDGTHYVYATVGRRKDGGSSNYDVNTGKGAYKFTVDYSVYNEFSVVLAVKNGTDLTTPVTFKPMIRLASDPDDTYEPYAMTNKELTDSAADQKTAINAIMTAATEAADFAAFKTAMGAITPVTRSLSLTKEDITEEVKEAEPEKTVTKKRTTKKAEEV